MRCRYCGKPGAEESVRELSEERLYVFTRCRNPECSAYDFIGNGWSDSMSPLKKEAYRAWEVHKALVPSIDD
jgi:hypothetical protein